ncbi:MAG: sulfotransferase domain-containing protein [Marinobacter sp.]|uniref:sulfotransferase domain-containing protein n=1 Tax=Marinobacter sp. TaxID=50741 RepID=UPI003299B8FE
MTLNVESKRKVLLYRAKRRGRSCVKGLYQRLNPSQYVHRVFVLGSCRSGTDILAHYSSKGWSDELVSQDIAKAFSNWRLRGLDAVEQAVDSSGAEVVLLRPIAETLWEREFLTECPFAAVIFVVRNPRYAINSMVRFFGKAQVCAFKNWVETDFARKSQALADLRKFIPNQCHADLSVENAAGLKWLLYESFYLFLDQQSNPRLTKIRYERLVQEPDEIMREACAFLGIKWSSAMTNEVYACSVSKNRKPGLSPAIEKQSSEFWGRLNIETRQNYSSATSIV